MTILSRRSRAIRYAFGALCLVALFGGQLTGLLSSLVVAKSSEAGTPAFTSSIAAVASAPQSSSCTSGTLDNTDQTFHHPSAIITPTCILAGAFTFYDAYTFNVSGCTNPSVTVSTCTGPCGTQSALDTILFVYQKAGGAPATPGSPIFAPGNPCTNIKAANNNFCAPASQTTTTVLTTGSTGDFVVVVSANLAGETGTYNLRVDAPGCTVTQVPSCIYSLGSSEASFLAAGASSSVTVTVAPACPWTAVSNDAFITVDSGSPGLGNGTVNYTVAANPGAARVGTMTIAGQTFTVTQEAGAVSLPCIMDALVSGNGTFTRPSTATIPPTCPVSPFPVITLYKAYEMTLSGCASGSVTASTCGTSPCTSAGTLADTILFLYRKADGSPSSPGSPIFDPTNPCANIVSGNNNFCGTLSQVTSILNSGSFVVVATSNAAGQTGTFNLAVTASGGCTVTFVPPCSSITGTVSGGGTICAGGSSTVTVTVSGGTPPYTVTLNNGGGTQTGSSPLNFVVSPSSTTTYSVTTATDSAGCPVNVTGSATVTVNSAPTTANAGPDQSVCGSTATLAGNTPSVGTGTWSLVSGSGTIASPGSPNTTVTGLGVGPNVFRWTISNSPCTDSTDDVTITRDATPPTALCKNITVALNASGNASITASQVDNGSSDSCGIASMTVAPDTFTCANKGPNSVTLTVTDNNGNSSQCIATVTIVDNTPPTITCPANVSATAAPGQSSATVTYPNPTISDNCPGVTAACSPPSGSSFPLGTTTVMCTATDTSNNQASCTFTVTVFGSLLVNADSFLRDGADNTNEGANNLLRIQSSGHNRVVVRFNMTGISTVGLQSATLILNITDNSDNWGPTGRLVDAHRLLADWTEGNGHTVGDQPNFRGTGEGVTWNCAKDSNIANMSDDCVSQWSGGTFAAATASPVLHTNGQLGDVSWNVTADVIAGASNGFVIKKQNEGQNGQVKYYSKEGAAVAGNPNLGPRLVLVYAP